jgi:hypothetical protein
MKTPSIAPILHHLVMHAPNGMGAKTIADLLDWKYATMMSELSCQPGHKLGADKVLQLMEITGSDAPLHFLARERCGAFIKLPPAPDGMGQIQEQCMMAVRDFGQLVGDTAEAIAEGKVTLEERKKILSDGHETVTAIMGLLKLVEG